MQRLLEQLLLLLEYILYLQPYHQLNNGYKLLLHHFRMQLVNLDNYLIVAVLLLLSIVPVNAVVFNAAFDSDFYVNCYPDLKAAFGNDACEYFFHKFLHFFLTFFSKSNFYHFIPFLVYFNIIGNHCLCRVLTFFIFSHFIIHFCEHKNIFLHINGGIFFTKY